MRPTRNNQELQEEGEGLIIDAIDALAHAGAWLFPLTVSLATRRDRLTATIALLQRELARLEDLVGRLAARLPALSPATRLVAIDALAGVVNAIETIASATSSRSKPRHDFLSAGAE
jgi:hypothetical protein